MMQGSIETKDVGAEYNKVTAVIALTVGLDEPKTDTERISFDMDQWDEEMFGKLPEWIQERIKKSTQYQQQHTPTDEIDFKDKTLAGTTQAEAQAETQNGCPI